jgi:phage baseplate assembly protein W
MANITIRSLAQKPKTNRGYTYSDLKLDLTFDYLNNNELLKKKQIKDSVNSLDYDAIKNSLISMFTTIPGQKILNPFFGLNLVKYLFEPVSEAIATSIASDITSGIATYEPRVKVKNLLVGYSNENQYYQISIELAIPQINNQSFKLVGTLSNSGFFLNN